MILAMPINHNQSYVCSLSSFPQDVFMFVLNKITLEPVLSLNTHRKASLSGTRSMCTQSLKAVRTVSIFHGSMTKFCSSYLGRCVDLTKTFNSSIYIRAGSMY